MGYVGPYGHAETRILHLLAQADKKDSPKTSTYDKYGWDVDDDNNLIENEKEQYWIEYIKVRFHEDEISISQIARELNACKVPAKRGEKWSHKQVKRILDYD